MIARTWRTGIDPARADEYEAFARKTSLPMFERQAGFCGMLLLRGGADCRVMTFWENFADIETLESSTSYRETTGRLLGAGFLQGPRSVLLSVPHFCAVPNV